MAAGSSTRRDGRRGEDSRGDSGSRGDGGGGAGRQGAGGAGRRPAERPVAEDRGAPIVRKGWGSVARRGAGAVRAGTEHGPDADGPEAIRRSRTRTDEFIPEEFVRVDERQRTPRSNRRPTAPRPVEIVELPADVAVELASAAGPDWNHLRDRASERMAAGMAAFGRERYRDASRMLKTVVELVPTAPSPRELLALSQYHQGYWKAALGNLEVFADLTGSVDQHPVRMDCYRALGRRAKVEAVYEELRRGSPDAEVLSEGRLVLAGSRADAGDLDGAVRVLVDAGAGRLVRNASERHLRQWYVLGDLMERSGDLARARELFQRVAAMDPDAYDVADRLRVLSPPRRPRRTSKGSGSGR